MICRTCNGAGWLQEQDQGPRYYPPSEGFPNGLVTETRSISQCGTCKGHGELVPIESLANCFQCDKRLNKCRCKPLIEQT